MKREEVPSEGVPRAISLTNPLYIYIYIYIYYRI